MKKDNNLEVTCTVYFDMTRRAPKLADWLASLPDEAAVVFGLRVGRDQLIATWTEKR